MATYFVSNSAGSDSNSGLSEGAPFQTVSRVNGLALNPGDRVRWRDGDTWSGTALNISRSGASNHLNPIVYERWSPVAGAPRPKFIQPPVNRSESGSGVIYITASNVVVDGLHASLAQEDGGQYSSAPIQNSGQNDPKYRQGRTVNAILVGGQYNLVQNCVGEGAENGFRVTGSRSRLLRNISKNNWRMTRANTEDYGAYSLHCIGGPQYIEIGWHESYGSWGPATQFSPGSWPGGGGVGSDGSAFETFGASNIVVHHSNFHNVWQSWELSGSNDVMFLYCLMYEGTGSWIHSSGDYAGGATNVRVWNCTHDLGAFTAGNNFILGQNSGHPAGNLQIFNSIGGWETSGKSVAYNTSGAITAGSNLYYPASISGGTGYTFAGTDIRTASAGFVDRAARDYRLLSSSPAATNAAQAMPSAPSWWDTAFNGPWSNVVDIDLGGSAVTGTRSRGAYQLGGTAPPPPPPPPPPPAVVTVSAPTLNKTNYVAGEAVTATATISTSGEAATITGAIFTFRQPGAAIGDWFSGADFPNTWTSQTIQPGAPVTVTATHTLPATAVDGTWTVHLYWSPPGTDGPQSNLQVGSGTPPPPPPPPADDVQVSNLQTAGSVLTWTKPSALAVGDYLIWMIQTTGATLTTPPAGSSERGTVVTSGQLRSYIRYRRVTDPTAEPATYTATLSAAGKHIGVQWRAPAANVHPTDPFSGTDTSFTGLPGAPGDFALPIVQPAHANALPVAFAGIANGDANIATQDALGAPAGMSEIVDVATGTTTDDRSVVVAIGQPTNPPSTTVYRRGVHVPTWGFQGSSTGAPTAGTLKGEPQSSYEFLAGRGLELARIPSPWHHLQPTLGGALSTEQLDSYKRECQRILNAGMRVVACVPFDYVGSVHEPRPASQIGSSFSVAQAVNLWTRLAPELKDLCFAFEIWNEPNGMGAGQIASLKTYCQDATTAIRAAGFTGEIWIPGLDDWQGSQSFMDWGAPWVTDPLNNERYIAHCYIASSGGSFPSGYNASAYSDTVLSRLAPFGTFLSTYGKRGGITETGIPSMEWAGISAAEQATWNSRLQKLYTFCNDRDIDVTYHEANSTYREPFRAYVANPDNGTWVTPAPGINRALAAAAVIEANLSLTAGAGTGATFTNRTGHPADQAIGRMFALRPPTEPPEVVVNIPPVIIPVTAVVPAVEASIPGGAEVIVDIPPVIVNVAARTPQVIVNIVGSDDAPTVLSPLWLPGTEVFIFRINSTTAPVWARETTLRGAISTRLITTTESEMTVIVPEDMTVRLTGLVRGGQYWATGFSEGRWRYVAFTAD